MYDTYNAELVARSASIECARKLCATIIIENVRKSDIIRDEYICSLFYTSVACSRSCVQSILPGYGQFMYWPSKIVSFEFYIFQIDRQNIKHDENHQKLRVRKHERDSESSSDRAS